MAGNRHNRPSLIPSSAADKPEKGVYINKSAAFLSGWEKEGNSALVMLYIKLFQHGYQCFSNLGSKEMKAFWGFNELIHKQTWQEVYKSASKQLGSKTGLAYTVIGMDKFPRGAFKDSLDPQTTLFELRVDQKMRVHGFRYKALFFLCWLDREHNLLK